MTAWRKTALVCGLLFCVGAGLFGCQQQALPTMTSKSNYIPPPLPTKGKKGTGGAVMDITDYAAPAGVKTGDYTGGLARRLAAKR